MPELNEVVGSTPAAVETKPETAASEIKTPPTTVAQTAVVEATVVAKPKEKKEKSKAKTETETEKVESSEKTEKEKTKKEKAPKKPKAEKTENEIEFARPPMEQLVRDFETLLTEQEIGDNKVVKLGYKCGKIIWGLENSDGKDFRIIAYKARKKSKSVNGKSRCIFYFGINQEEAKAFIKQHPEAKISTFGKCAVQCQTPVELILDKVTYTEKFGKDIDKVMSVLKKLTHAAVHSKKEQYKLLKEKAEAKAEKKAKKKEKAEKK